MDAQPKPLYRTRIRELRRAARLTLKQLADMMGTTPQTIQRLETDGMTVSIDWLEKIAFALDVKVADLVEQPAQAQTGDAFIAALRLRYAAERREPMPDPEWYGLQIVNAAVQLCMDCIAAQAERVEEDRIMDQAVTVAAMAMRLARQSGPVNHNVKTQIAGILARQKETAA